MIFSIAKNKWLDGSNKYEPNIIDINSIEDSKLDYFNIILSNEPLITINIFKTYCNKYRSEKCYYYNSISNTPTVKKHIRNKFKHDPFTNELNIDELTEISNYLYMKINKLEDFY